MKINPKTKTFSSPPTIKVQKALNKLGFHEVVDVPKSADTLENVVVELKKDTTVWGKSGKEQTGMDKGRFNALRFAPDCLLIHVISERGTIYGQVIKDYPRGREGAYRDNPMLYWDCDKLVKFYPPEPPPPRVKMFWEE